MYRVVLIIAIVLLLFTVVIDSSFGERRQPYRFTSINSDSVFVWKVFDGDSLGLILIADELGARAFFDSLDVDSLLSIDGTNILDILSDSSSLRMSGSAFVDSIIAAFSGVGKVAFDSASVIAKDTAAKVVSDSLNNLDHITFLARDTTGRTTEGTVIYDSSKYKIEGYVRNGTDYAWREIGVEKPPYDYFTDAAKSGGGAVDVLGRPAQSYNGRTYIAFAGEDFETYVCYYDSATSKWSDTYQVTYKQLGNYHITPALGIDNYGYIHIFTGYSYSYQYWRSTNPEDITQWQSMPDSKISSNGAAYVQFACLYDDSLRLVFRSGGHLDNWSMISSGDTGMTWTDEDTILSADRVDSTGFYGTISEGRGDSSINFSFCYLEEGYTPAGGKVRGGRYNAYLVRFIDGRWRTIGNSSTSSLVISTPITKANADTIGDDLGEPRVLVYNSYTTNCQFGVVGSMETDATARVLKLAYLRGGNINVGQSDTLCTAHFVNASEGWHNFAQENIITNNLFNTYDIDVIDNDTVYIYIAENQTTGGTYVSNKGGQIKRYKSTDLGNTFTLDRTITQLPAISDVTGENSQNFNNVFFVKDATNPNTRIIFQELHNNNDPLWYLDAQVGTITFDSKLYLWGDAGFIQQTKADKPKIYDKELVTKRLNIYDGVADSLGKFKDSCRVNVQDVVFTDSVQTDGTRPTVIKFTTDSSTKQIYGFILDFSIPSDFAGFEEDTAIIHNGFVNGTANVRLFIGKDGLIPLASRVTEDTLGHIQRAAIITYNSWTPIIQGANNLIAGASSHAQEIEWLINQNECAWVPRDVMRLIYKVYLNNNTGIAYLDDPVMRYFKYVRRP